jgi:hypothetical protein
MGLPRGARAKTIGIKAKKDPVKFLLLKSSV